MLFIYLNTCIYLTPSWDIIYIFKKIINNFKKMENIAILATLIVSISVIIVWVFRYDNIVQEFKQYGISNLLRNIVGASKISLSTILIIGLCYETKPLLIGASVGMAFLMICAQYFHIKVKNPWSKFVPSFVLLLLSLFIAAFNHGLFK